MSTCILTTGAPRRIGFISTRFCGTDGVTLEARKWAHILGGMGHSCFWMAGQLEAAAEASYDAPLAFFNHPEVAAVQRQLFGVAVRARAVTNQIQSIKERLKDDLYRYIAQLQLEVLVPENILAIPMHVPLGLWAEDALRGRNAATLYLASADKTPETVLAQVDSQPASSLTLTLDRSLQQQAQAAMDGLPGAIVVMEVDTGRVLAMVSSPAPDTNWYDPANYNFMALVDMLCTSSIEKNRAATSTYPLGSVFKIITWLLPLRAGCSHLTPNMTALTYTLKSPV